MCFRYAEIIANFLSACEVGDLEGVMNGIPCVIANVIDHQRRTGLHLSAQNGHYDIVDLIIQVNADVDCEMVDGSTPMLLAAEGGHVNIIKFLLTNNADISHENYDGLQAIHLASRKGHLGVIELLHKNQTDINARCVDGSTPLMLAVLSDSLHCVKYLLLNGANPEVARIEDKWRAIHLAVLTGNNDILQTLVNRGVELNSKTSQSYTALYMALQAGHSKCMDTLLKAGASVNQQTNKGVTPLLEATNHGRTALVQMLVKYKADPSLADNNGLAPIHVTCRNKSVDSGDNNCLEVIDMLCDAGAKVNQTVINGQTACYIATQVGHDACLRRLIQRGANPTIPDQRDWQSLHVAVQSACLPVLDVLLESGKVDVNAQTYDGSTCLMMASERGDRPIVERLIHHQADIKLKDIQGRQAVDLALINYHGDIVRIIQENEKLEVS